MRSTHHRSCIGAILALLASVGGAGCSSPAAMPPGAQDAGRPASMTVDASLVRDDGGKDGPQELVMSQIRITDASGATLAAPRILSRVGEPASIQLGFESGMTDVRVHSHRDGADVFVDAVLTRTDGPERLTARVKAKAAAGLPVP
jgi:hypothetical protein